MPAIGKPLDIARHAPGKVAYMIQLASTRFQIRTNPVVPPSATAVPRQTYREWMKNSELCDLTASEELTLEEEYAMQRGPSLPTSAPPCRL